VTHWLSAVIVITLMVTGVILYVPSLSAAVGLRLLIEDIHVYAGVSVFVPLISGLTGRWGRDLRRDLRGLNRFSRADKAWLFSLGRRSRHEIGKFNPGQKLNTFAIAGFLGVLLGTGLILRWGNFVPVNWRTGATFTHDWFALFLIVIVLGHVGMAIAHPEALRSMFSGSVTPKWVQRHAPAWRPIDMRSDVSSPVPAEVLGGPEFQRIHQTTIHQTKEQ
jgi:formate dehydrogenase subunit gamma